MFSLVTACLAKCEELVGLQVVGVFQLDAAEQQLGVGVEQVHYDGTAEGAQVVQAQK